jgi:hypothetical protein
VPGMLKKVPQYEATAWLLTMQRIGQALRKRYEPPKEPPPELLRLVQQIDKKSKASVHGKLATSQPPTDSRDPPAAVRARRGVG